MTRIIKQDFPSYLIWSFGFLIAFSINLFVGLNTDTFPDGVIYYEQAIEIKKYLFQKQFEESKIQLPIGISLILLVFSFLPINEILLFKLFQCGLYGVYLLLVNQVLKNLQLQKSLQNIILCLIAIDPFTLSFVTGVQSEMFAACAILIWINIYLSSGKNPTWTRITAFSHLFSVFVVICRPNYFLVYVVFLLFFIATRSSKARLRETRRVAKWFLIPLAVFHIFTYFLYQGFIFLSVNGPPNLYLSCQDYLLPQITGIASSQENQDINTRYFRELKNFDLEALENSSVYQRYKRWRSQSVSSCMQNLDGALSMYLLRLLLIWRPFVNFGSQSYEVFLISLLFGICLLVGFIWFIVFGRRFASTRELHSITIITATAFAFSVLPSAFQIRHKIAGFESVQWICLGVFLNHLLLHYKGETLKRSREFVLRIRKGRLWVQ